MFVFVVAAALLCPCTTSTEPGAGPQGMRREVVLGASPRQVWESLGAGDDEDAWRPGAALVEGDERPLARLVDESGPVRVLSLDPGRMLSWGSDDAWGVLTLEEASPRHTRACVTVFGAEPHAVTQAWDAWNVSLHQAFPDPADETERIMAIARRLCGDWSLETTMLGQRLAGRTKLIEQLDGHVIYAQGWLAKGDTPMFEHAHMVLFRDPGGLGVRLWSCDEHGAVTDGWATLRGDDTLITDWTQHLPGGGTQAIRVEYTVVSSERYRATIQLGSENGFLTMGEIEYQRTPGQK